MGRGHRIGLMLAAAAIAVLAFVLLRPEEAENPDRIPTTPQESRPAGGETAPAEAEPEPQLETIRIVDGAVEGGARRITAQAGDTVRIRVQSDSADEIHLHGYDLTRRVTPSRAARFRFEADSEGVFEIEAHDLGHVVIGRLVVEP